jgi:hypothetical protein
MKEQLLCCSFFLGKNMSMNLYLCATAKMTLHLDKKDKSGVQRHSFDLWQTPTDDTYKMLNGYTEELYKSWVLQHSKDEQSPIYADNDFFQKGEIVGYETYNSGKYHIQELNDWLKRHQGWKISWFEQ